MQYSRWKFAYLSGRTKKFVSRKTKINFYKKTTPQLWEHVGLQNMKVGGKTNLVDLPLFVWCMLTLALKDKISCMVLGTYYIFRMFVSQKIPSMKLWSKILQYLCIISRIEGVHYDTQTIKERIFCTTWKNKPNMGSKMVIWCNAM